MLSFFLNLIFMSQSYAATVSAQDVLESKIRSVSPLSFDKVLEVYSSNPTITLDCVPEDPELTPDEDVIAALAGLLPAEKPHFMLTFATEPQGDGFNIMVARDNAAVSSDHFLVCNADSEYRCPSLTWSTTKTLPLLKEGYVPEAEVTEEYEIYATAQGQFYIKYSYSVASWRFGLFNRHDAAESYFASYLCRN